MIKSHPDSRIEIWSALYINNSDNKPRMEADDVDKVDIIQIECGSNGDYIVEVVNKEKYIKAEEITNIIEDTRKSLGLNIDKMF